MAKNTTKKIKQLKAKKAEKITNDELNKVQSMISNINKFKMDLGGLELQKHALTSMASNLNNQLAVMQTEFEKTYGTSDINIQTGEINHKKDE